MTTIGVIVIGRNEGDRLRRCLDSAVGQGHDVVYVDSGSNDGSVELARSQGVSVVELDPAVAFTAGRARNAGVDHLLATAPETDYLQFIDGDCEFAPGWLPRARAELDTHPDLAVVCGRLRERYPERSIYNRLADIEWNGPLGKIDACGGIAMIRAVAFRQVGGFDSTLIAGEEPELCLRLRRRGWSIARIDAEMAVHDIAMTRFAQWWRRAIRGGHAYAEAAARYGSGPERFRRRELRSIWLWGVVIPVLAAVLAWPTCGASLLLLLVYPLQYYRIKNAAMRRLAVEADARLYAIACLVGKVPEAIGMITYWWARLTSKRRAIIEYKAAR